MPTTTSAKKRVRRNARREVINHARTNRVATYVRKVESAIARRDKPGAQAAFREAQPELMRGVSKGVVHRNAAARKLSRLSARIKSLS
jgi:small subunit ribosomal protein S20